MCPVQLKVIWKVTRVDLSFYLFISIFTMSSLTAAYWQKSPLRTVTDISPGCLATEAAPLGAKAFTKSVSKTNRSMSTTTTQSCPLSFHRLRYSGGAFMNISVSVLTLIVLTVGKSLVRDWSTPANSRYHCAWALTSDWSSVVCWRLSVVTVICSSSTNWR